MKIYNKTSILTIIISLVILAFSILYFNKKNISKKKTVDLTILNEIKYELKKCFLFKKYCLINSPKTYYGIQSLLNKSEDSICFFNNNCEDYKMKEIVLIIKNQSPKANKYYSFLNKYICDSKKKNEYYNYFDYLLYVSNKYSREDKKKIYKLIHLEDKIEEIKSTIISCN